MECFLDSSIHKINFSTKLEFDGCKQWCRGNNQCGGFTVYKDVCIFKNQSCKDNLVNSENSITFIKEEPEY